MISFIDIKPGQWVLAFDEPYGPFNRTMPEHIETYASRGGGWESHRKTEILHVYEVSDVRPKTYTIGEAITHPRAYLTKRQYRSHVIAAGGTKAEMIALRDRFFAIGIETGTRIEAEMYRRIEKFAAREEAKAVKAIHRCLPHFFPKTGGSTR